MTVTTYESAGVSLSAADRFEEMIQQRIASAWPDVGQEIGGFAGGGPVPEGAKRVEACTDGPGTKIILAALMGMFDGIGADVVAMSAVDSYVSKGQAPSYLLDSLKVARLVPDLHIRIIESIIQACKLAGCKLVGGETAEMPGLYRYDWMVDVDTFAVGFPDDSFQYAEVLPGQRIYGWPSNGVAANGFSLVRKVFSLKDDGPAKIRRRLQRHYSELQCSLGEALLKPTPIWIPEIEAAKTSANVVFSGHAHITGGGMPGNIPRIMPVGLKAVIDKSSWQRPPIFSLIEEVGQVPPAEMDRVFNQGIMVVSIVSEGKIPANSAAIPIGQVEVQQSGDEPQVVFTGQYL